MASPSREEAMQLGRPLDADHNIHAGEDEFMDTSPQPATGHAHADASPPTRSSPTNSSRQPPSASTSISYESSNYASDVSLSPDHADPHHLHRHSDDNPNHQHNDESSPRRSSVTSHTSSNATTGGSKGSSAVIGEATREDDAEASAGVVKDEVYWERRKKNNDAAKRSREKRRLNDMAMEQRLMQLAEENKLLKSRLAASNGLHPIGSTSHSAGLPQSVRLLPTGGGASSSVIVATPQQPPIAALSSTSVKLAGSLDELSQNDMGDQLSKHRRHHPPLPVLPSIQSANGSAFSVPAGTNSAAASDGAQQPISSTAVKVPQFLYAPPMADTDRARLGPYLAIHTAAGSGDSSPFVNSAASAILPPQVLPFMHQPQPQITAPMQLATLGGSIQRSNVINVATLGQLLQLQSALAATNGATGSGVNNGPSTNEQFRCSPIAVGHYQPGPTWPLNSMALPRLAGVVTAAQLPHQPQQVEQLQPKPDHGAMQLTTHHDSCLEPVRSTGSEITSDFSAERALRRKSGKERRRKEATSTADGDKGQFTSSIAAYSGPTASIISADSGSLDGNEVAVNPIRVAIQQPPITMRYPLAQVAPHNSTASNPPSNDCPSSAVVSNVAALAAESLAAQHQKPVQLPAFNMGQIQLMAAQLHSASDSANGSGKVSSGILAYNHPGAFAVTGGKDEGPSHRLDSEVGKNAKHSQPHSVTFAFSSSSSTGTTGSHKLTSSAGTSTSTSRVDRQDGPSSSSSILGSLLVTKRRSPSVPESRTESMSGLMDSSVGRQVPHQRARTPPPVMDVNGRPERRESEPSTLSIQREMAPNGYHHADRSENNHRRTPHIVDSNGGHKATSATSSGSHSPGSPHSFNSTDGSSGYSGALPSSATTTATTTSNSTASCASHGATYGSSRENVGDGEEGSSLPKHPKKSEKGEEMGNGDHHRSSTSPSTYNSGDDQPPGLQHHSSAFGMRGRLGSMSREVGINDQGDNGMDGPMGEDNGDEGMDDDGVMRHGDDLERYMDRRRRNNEAAKRCRANRRAMFEYRSRRAQQLEVENCELRQEMLKLSNELEQLKAIIATSKSAQLLTPGPLAPPPPHPPTASI